MKRPLKNMLLVIGSLSVSVPMILLLLELSLRLFTHPSVTPGYVQTSPQRRYTLKPLFSGKTYSAACNINSLGLRDHERPVLDNAYRIAVFGDSVTFGIGVEVDQTFPKIMEKRLNKERGRKSPVQTFNFGVPSYNTIQEFAYIRESYDTFKPNMILVVFCAQNDTQTTATSDPSINRFPVVVTVKNILRNLYSYDFLATKLYSMLYKLKARRHVDEYQERFFYDNVLYEDQFGGWVATKECFREMKQFCDDRDITLVFAISANNYKLAPVPEDDLSYPIVKKIIEALNEAGIEHAVVLDNAFRDYAGKEGLLWVLPTDGHFSALAHELATNEILNYVDTHKLLTENG